jgi:hypothetical protein
VKKVYKSKGHNLSQQQALIIAKESYPGKGNVLGRDEKEFKIQVKSQLPPNPVRVKRDPIPKQKPAILKRGDAKERNTKNNSKNIHYNDKGRERDREKDKKVRKYKKREPQKYNDDSSSESEKEYRKERSKIREYKKRKESSSEESCSESSDDDRKHRSRKKYSNYKK